MSEPVVTTELTRDPIPPDPAIERERKVEGQLILLAELERRADLLRARQRLATTHLHATAAELTKARQELARLVSRE